MVEEVIKRNGKKEDFIKEKIIVSALDIGTKHPKAKKIANNIEKKFKDQKEVKSSEIKKELIKELNKEKAIPEEKTPQYLELINKVEEELNQNPSFGDSETLLISLKDVKEVNGFTREIGNRKNVKIKEINHIENKYVTEIKIYPPTSSFF